MKVERRREGVMLVVWGERSGEDCLVWGWEREECERSRLDCAETGEEDCGVQEPRVEPEEELLPCETSMSRVCASPPEHWPAWGCSSWRAGEWQSCWVNELKVSERMEWQLSSRPLHRWGRAFSSAPERWWRVAEPEMEHPSWGWTGPGKFDNFDNFHETKKRENNKIFHFASCRFYQNYQKF